MSGPVSGRFCPFRLWPSLLRPGNKPYLFWTSPHWRALDFDCFFVNHYVINSQAREARRSMKCPKCHSENPDDTLYCGQCGARLLSIAPISAS
ncbi:MAG: zinc-ribbon domain-containing protein, partial [Candidatus Aminicenantes bacterium]|nr:zinc-ribbon domain-containing protein [Candidatus Aminicenantes bacterium]